MDGDKIELTIEKVGTLKFNVKDEHKRTWARTTRSQHKDAGKEGPHTPQLSRQARGAEVRLPRKKKAPRLPAAPSSQEQPGCRLRHCIRRLSA